MVELSSLDVRALALELRPLEDAYLDKVYQTRPDEFVFKLRHPRLGPAHLVVRVGAFAARAAEAPPTPESPSPFAMVLRKHLSGARIRRVEQHEFDRVLRVQLERHGEPLEVVAELFGKGNLILAGPGRTILASMRTETFAHRTIRRGEPLVFPPPRANPLVLARAEFEDLVQRSEKDAVRFLALDLALGGELAEELLHRAGLAKHPRAADLAPPEVERLWAALRDILDRPAQPAVVHTAKGAGLQSVPFTAPLFRDAAREPAPSMSDAILRLAGLEEARAAPAVDEERARLERQIGHQERALVDLDAEARRWERRGHLAFAHYATVAHVLQKAKASLEAQGWSALEEVVRRRAADDAAWATPIASVDGRRGRIVVRLEDEEVPLDPQGSLEHNAAVLYDESKRIRTKLESAKVALADARRRLAERAARPAPTPAGAKRRAPAKRFWFEAHRWFYSSEGFLVVAGRDAASNEKLVKRHLSAGDRFAHADVHGAPSVVVKCEGRTPGEATLREACQFGATYSKAFSQFAAADAYWVHPEQVSKTAESGEYVPKGAFVIRGARNYHHKLTLQLALGVLRLDAQGRPGDAEAPHPRLVGGPPSALEHYTRRLARVERGDLKPSDAARQLAPVFGVTADEVIAALPAGTVRVAPPPEARP